MRLATIVDGGRERVAVVDDAGAHPLSEPWSMRAVAARPRASLDELRLDPAVGLDGVAWAAVVPDPGAIYTIGRNYPAAGELPAGRPERPMVLGKLPTAVAAAGATVGWDRSVTPNVDGECELGVVIGAPGFDVPVDRAMEHVFGYTIVNDMNSVDPWLDGDQWLLGKSMAGFCPVGPWIVTADELDPADLALGTLLNGVPIQDGRTSQMRFSIAEVIAYISRHVELRPGDLIATGTPPRLPGPPGPDRHLRPGDMIACRIEGIGELPTTIA